VVNARRLLFIAGQVPINASGQVVGPRDIGRQVGQVFKNIGAVLKAARADFSNVVQFTTFLVSAADLPEFYAARKRHYRKLYPGADYPPNTLLIVNRLGSEDFLLEIQTIAALD
jgi:enamine deaminase RidA (YjgF/YER057c/UK114 family)